MYTTFLYANCHRNYLRLRSIQNGLVVICHELKVDFPLFFHLCRRLKNEVLNKEGLICLLGNETNFIEFNKRVIVYVVAILCYAV